MAAKSVKRDSAYERSVYDNSVKIVTLEGSTCDEIVCEVRCSKQKYVEATCSAKEPKLEVHRARSFEAKSCEIRARNVAVHNIKTFVC